MHMPGHKGRVLVNFASQFDVTELAGLDDLSYPTGVLKALEERISRLYGVEESVISVSGGSGGLMAAIGAVAHRGKALLVPRNAHRSVIHALVICGLEPIWYEPVWNSQWAVWDSVSPESFEVAISGSKQNSIAGALVVSPTFAGAVSDIEALASLAHVHKLPLIVDEAQGGHFLPASLGRMPRSACQSGADLVVHSFHKTLGALTQTGAVHAVSQKLVSAANVRAAMRLIATSSPNYVLLASIEQAILLHETENGIEKLAAVADLGKQLRLELQSKLEVYTPESECDPLRVLTGSATYTGVQLDRFFTEHGIFSEAVLGAGCLLLMGAGTNEADLEIVAAALASLPRAKENALMPSSPQPDPVEQVMSPRQAFFAPSELVFAVDAAGRIAADCLAPCPPGMPVCVPGARIPREFSILAADTQIRVLTETG